MEFNVKNIISDIIDECVKECDDERIDYTDFEIIEGVVVHEIEGEKIVLDQNMKEGWLDELVGCQKHVKGYYYSDVKKAKFNIENRVQNYTNIFDNINELLFEGEKQTADRIEISKQWGMGSFKGYWVKAFWEGVEHDLQIEFDVTKDYTRIIGNIKDIPDFTPGKHIFWDRYDLFKNEYNE